MKIFNQLKSIKTFKGPEEFHVPMKKEWEDYPTDKVLYRHLDEDDLPYYVGYGSEDRPEQVGKTQRNDDWHEVHDAHGLRVEILLANLHEHCAIVMEQWLIAKYIKIYGRFNEGGLMTNRSTGGYGASGWKKTEEQRANDSAARKISHNRPEVKAKNSFAQKIAQNRPEVKAKNIAAHTGKFGEQNGNFQGYSVGINEEQFVILCGEKEMNGCGFNQGNISSCISGRVNSHKGFRWTRHSTLNPEDFAGLTPFNELSAERLNAAKTN